VLLPQTWHVRSWLPFASLRSGGKANIKEILIIFFSLENSMNAEAVVDAKGKQNAGDRAVAQALKSLNKFAPLLTILVAAISFVGGIVFNALSARQKEVETKAEEWRLALEKVNFEQENLLTTAYLMDSFGADTEYHDQARQIEVEALIRTTDPTIFDLMFSTMLRHSTNQDQPDLLQVARALSIELDTLYESSPSSGKLTLVDFLEHPENAYDPTSNRYQRTLCLLWEIDSISDYLRKAWAGQYPGTALSPGGLDFRNVFLVNRPMPSSVLHPPTNPPQYFKTCKVADKVTSEQGLRLTCQADPHG